MVGLDVVVGAGTVGGVGAVVGAPHAALQVTVGHDPVRPLVAAA